MSHLPAWVRTVLGLGLLIAAGLVFWYWSIRLGIPKHDRAELNGLTHVFGGGLSRVPAAPIKAQTGSLAAGSGVEAVAAVMSVHANKIPAALNTRKQIDGAKLNVSHEVRDAKVNVAVSSVYSLGGQNAALVFKGN